MIRDILDQIKNIVLELEADIVKVEKGRKSSIAKARKKLQILKKVSQDLRIDLQEIKKSETKKELVKEEPVKQVEEPTNDQPNENTIDTFNEENLDQPEN